MLKYINLMALIILLSVISTDGYGQKKRLEKADEAFEAGEFYDAIDLYKDAYAAIQDKALKTEVVFKRMPSLNSGITGNWFLMIQEEAKGLLPVNWRCNGKPTPSVTRWWI